MFVMVEIIQIPLKTPGARGRGSYEIDRNAKYAKYAKKKISILFFASFALFALESNTENCYDLSKLPMSPRLSS